MQYAKAVQNMREVKRMGGNVDQINVMIDSSSKKMVRAWIAHLIIEHQMMESYAGQTHVPRLRNYFKMEHVNIVGSTREHKEKGNSVDRMTVTTVKN